MMPDTPNANRLALLALGGIAGLLLATWGLLVPQGNSTNSLPKDTVAMVNGQPISRERFIALASDLAADSTAPLNPTDYEFVLDRLIDEELLIDRGIELGLPEQDPAVRKAIAAAVIAQTASEAAAQPAEDEELRAFLASDPQFFSRNDRYRVHWWRLPISSGASEESAGALLQRLKMTDTVPPSAAALPVPESRLPAQPLPAAKLRDYLGPQLVRMIQDAQTNEWIGPVSQDGAFHLLHVLALETADPQDFETLRPVLEAEYRRRMAEGSLRDYLQWLRSRAEIVRIDDLPD